MSTSRKIPFADNKQFDLFEGVPAASKGVKLQTSVKTGRRFVACDAREIYLSSMRLEVYLKHANQRTPLIVSQLLDAQDWAPFEQRYAATGRAPYSPRYMMGLILYGVMQGVMLPPSHGQ